MHIRIMSIDPGGTTTGIAITDLDMLTGKCYIVDSHTIHLDKLIKRKYGHNVIIYGEKFARIIALKEAMTKLLVAWQPEYIVSEGPYLGSFVTTFASLTSCVMAIRLAIYEWEPYKDVTVLDPATVKKAVGVSGKSGDKNLMRIAVAKRGLIFTDVLLEKLDEHSVDAIAVGQAYIELFIRRQYEFTQSCLSDKGGTPLKYSIR